jgi:ribosome-binding protein aMBF1 (putative translation factor)
MPKPSLCFGRLPERKKEHEMASFYPYLYETALALCVDARVKAGLTQAQLAERFGQTERFVASYESGERLLDPAEYIAICRAIGVDPYELLQKAEKEVGS